MSANSQKGLLLVLFVGLLGAYTAFVVLPANRWAVLHSVYTSQEIADKNIRVEQVFRPRSALVSNGERRSYGIGPDVLSGTLWLGGFAAAFCLLNVLSRRFLPVAHATFFRRTP
jgi:hypothetical protein